MIEKGGRQAPNRTMTSPRGDYDRMVKERSGWLIPLAVFVVTAALSGLILGSYLLPTPSSFIEEHPSPTSRVDPVRLMVGGLALVVPANYLLYANARQGGDRNVVELYAEYPKFQGYSDQQSQAFAGNAADSPIIYILIREDHFNIGEAERLKRIYLSYVTRTSAAPGPFGLSEYGFRNDSGYRNEDLLVGNTVAGPVVMRCVRYSREVTNPSCLRDERLPSGVALSYRFKRSHLANWREIATGVDHLMQSFIAHAH
jgi:hypothetical protein